MDGIKIAAGVVFGGLLAAAFYAASMDAQDGRLLSTQEEFQQEAESLLKKNRYEPGEVGAFDYYEASEVAQIQLSFKSDAGEGTAYIGCSGSEVLQDGTHCRIGSVVFNPAKKAAF